MAMTIGSPPPCGFPTAQEEKKRAIKMPMNPGNDMMPRILCKLQGTYIEVAPTNATAKVIANNSEIRNFDRISANPEPFSITFQIQSLLRCRSVAIEAFFQVKSG
jgi:hypothetical protein